MSPRINRSARSCARADPADRAPLVPSKGGDCGLRRPFQPYLGRLREALAKGAVWRQLCSIGSVLEHIVTPARPTPCTVQGVLWSVTLTIGPSRLVSVESDLDRPMPTACRDGVLRILELRDNAQQRHRTPNHCGLAWQAIVPLQLRESALEPAIGNVCGLAHGSDCRCARHPLDGTRGVLSHQFALPLGRYKGVLSHRFALPLGRYKGCLGLSIRLPLGRYKGGGFRLGTSSPVA